MKVESLIDCTHGHGIHLVMQTQHIEAIHWSSGETEIIYIFMRFWYFLKRFITNGVKLRLLTIMLLAMANKIRWNKTNEIWKHDPGYFKRQRMMTNRDLLTRSQLEKPLSARSHPADGFTCKCLNAACRTDCLRCCKSLHSSNLSPLIRIWMCL